ncbi:biosynthetic-type acetolactate synthase large subunit [Natronospora cellulosivora (SeqCode)]
MTGAKIFVESLYREKVEVIFAYPGAKVITIYDELFKSNFNHILPHHEQGGIHAAEGYAKATGKVGVCMTTSGPGATNLITGLADAYMDSVPIVAFTGQVPRNLIGTDSFQEADIKGISTPITKHNYLVEDIKDLTRIIKEAFFIARTGRPGPVLVDIPADILNEEIEFEYPETISFSGYHPNNDIEEEQIKSAAELINNAKKPVIYAGGGCIISGASDEVRALAKKASIPVTTTLMGIGTFNENHNLSLGMLGMHGTTEANLAITNSDLIIALGARFDDRVTGKIDKFAPNADIIHVDIDSAELEKLLAVNIAIRADVKDTLKEILPLVDNQSNESWLEEIESWKHLDKKYKNNTGKTGKLVPHSIIEELYNQTNGDALITTEVGQHQMWAAKFYKYSKARSFISSGGLGTMGFGFPAAIGAKIGKPNEKVICIAGDGSFQMNIQELATIAKNDISVIIIILNNQYLGMVRQWQELFFDKRYAGTCLRRHKNCSPDCSSPGDDCPEILPNFVTIASGYGIKGKRISKIEDVKPALKEALNSNESYILDFIIEEEENVFPMVPAGGSLEDMILKKDIDKD